MTMVNESDRDFFLRAATALGDELCRDAVWDGPRCGWLGWSTEVRGAGFAPAYRAVDSSLYGGVAGIAVFLGRLARVTREPLLLETAHGALRTLVASSEDRVFPQQAGLWSGTAGVALALLELGQCLDSAEATRHARELLTSVDWRRLPREQWDLMSGAAGVVPVLLRAATELDEPRLRESAIAIGDRLLEGAVEDAHGVSWSSPTPQSHNLVGLSHGTSGALTALLELHADSGEARFLTAAIGALRYERHHFSEVESNWPDFRLAPGAAANARPGYPIAWCHGASGVGVSRLRVRELLPEDSLVLPELDAAMRACVRYMTSAIAEDAVDYSLCHGVAGNAEFLLELGVALGRADLCQLASTAARTGINTFQAKGAPWPCGVQNAGVSPSLMLGAAGIGHFFLRLSDGGRTPSLLVLRPTSPARKEKEPS